LLDDLWCRVLGLADGQVDVRLVGRDRTSHQLTQTLEGIGLQAFQVGIHAWFSLLQWGLAGYAGRR
jgi:hypothetical protein